MKAGEMTMTNKIELPMVNSVPPSSPTNGTNGNGGVAVDLSVDLGTRQTTKVRMARYPDAGPSIRAARKQRVHKVDVLLVNPPSPDGAVWIRSQHRVGRRSRENMIWPQVSLAQLAAMVHPSYSVEIVDAIAERMSWRSSKSCCATTPRYLHHPGDGANADQRHVRRVPGQEPRRWTMAFGTHVTPMVARDAASRSRRSTSCCAASPNTRFKELVETPRPASTALTTSRLAANLGGRSRASAGGATGEIVVNADRPFVPSLDDLPMPLHHLLPLERYRMPLIKGPYTFIVTSRGCTAGCTYCIKHVSYQWSVRLRSPEKIVEEIWLLNRLGIHNIHMYADLFTVNREQVVELCQPDHQAKA